MAIVLQRPSMGQRYNEALQSSLIPLMQQLAQQKFMDMAQRQQQQYREQGLAGILPDSTPEQRYAASLMPESSFNTWLKQALQNPQQEEYARQLNNIIGTGDMQPSSVDTSKPPRLTEKQATNLAKLQMQRQASESAQQEKLRPYIQKNLEEYGRWEDISKTATNLLNIIEQHRNEFPGALVGNAPEALQSYLIRNPAIREYQAGLNDLIDQMSMQTRGNVTNMKIKLKQAAKAGLSQPLATQEAILKKVLARAERESNAKKYMLSLRNKDTGNYPTNYESKVAEFRSAQKNPLQYPHYYKPGTIIEEDGEVYINVGGKEWKPYKE